MKKTKSFTWKRWVKPYNTYTKGQILGYHVITMKKEKEITKIKGKALKNLKEVVRRDKLDKKNATKELYKMQSEILKHFNWCGARMIFPSKYGYFVIELADLLKTIKFKEKI